jgi:hypothetical protein
MNEWRQFSQEKVSYKKEFNMPPLPPPFLTLSCSSAFHHGMSLIRSQDHVLGFPSPQNCEPKKLPLLINYPVCGTLMERLKTD